MSIMDFFIRRDDGRAAIPAPTFDRAVFFDYCRHGVMGPTLDQDEVDGAGIILDAMEGSPLAWCIDTMATASRGDQVLGGSVPPSDFLVDQSTPELFLENCVAGSSQYSLNAKYGKIWKRGGHFPMATFTSNGGSVVDY